MKRCGICGEVKPLDEFHLYARQGRQVWCKPCRKEYDRAYHARNAEKRPAAMEWDHLPGHTKHDDVSSLARAGKTRQFHAELAKCELVCANCHAVRSYERRHGA